MPFRVQQWSATTAGIGTGIRLDEVIASRILIRTAGTADDAQTHGALSTEGITENHGQFPHPNRVGIA
jgi:hypothetical protein